MRTDFGRICSAVRIVLLVTRIVQRVGSFTRRKVEREHRVSSESLFLVHIFAKPYRERTKWKGQKAALCLEVGPPSVDTEAAGCEAQRSREVRRRVKRGKEGLGCVSLPPSGAHLPSPQQSRTVRSDQELRLRSRTNDSLLLSPTIDHFPPPHDRAAPRELFDLLPTLRYPLPRVPRFPLRFSPLSSDPIFSYRAYAVLALFRKYKIRWVFSFARSLSEGCPLGGALAITKLSTRIPRRW